MKIGQLLESLNIIIIVSKKCFGRRNGHTQRAKNIEIRKCEIIMEEILPLLNINIPYYARISQISKIIKKENYLELNSKRFAEDGIVLFGYERKYNKQSEYLKSNDDNTNTFNNDLYNDEIGKDFLFNLLNNFIFPIEDKKDNYSLYENSYIRDFNTHFDALMKIKKYKTEKKYFN